MQRSSGRPHGHYGCGARVMCKADLWEATAGHTGTTVVLPVGRRMYVSNQLKEDDQCQHHTGKMIAITHRRVLHGNGLLPNV